MGNYVGNAKNKYSPHAWGWTAELIQNTTLTSVFPTRVGMNQLQDRCKIHSQCIPHMRGDEPEGTGEVGKTVEYSPHAWGWTIVNQNYRQELEVFPTRVGMNHIIRPWWLSQWCIPHTRGNEPLMMMRRWKKLTYFPHAWGWTSV